MATDNQRKTAEPANAVVYGRHLSALLVCLCLGTAALVRSSPPPPNGADNERFLTHTIDPNHAPWWRLTALPGVGKTLAQRIIKYREQAAQRPAFAHLDDLQNVHGIGPMKVRNIKASGLVCIQP